MGKFMTGIIVTGHGSFATGITSGLKLLAGEPEYYESVDFSPEDSVGSLTEKLEAAVKRLDGCEEILVLTDIKGGSPFNVALRMKLQRGEGFEVIGGTNLPVLLDAYLSRDSGKSVKELAYSSAEAGREQLVWYEQSLSAQAEEEDYEE